MSSNLGEERWVYTSLSVNTIFLDKQCGANNVVLDMNVQLV